MNSSRYYRDLHILNSYHENLQILEVSVSSQSPSTEQPVLEVRNATLLSFSYTLAVSCRFFCNREGFYAGFISIRTNSTIESLSEFTIPYEYHVVNGTIVTESPLYYCLKSSVRSKLVTIPIRMRNFFNTPVVITHIGIPETVTSLLSISNHRNETRFSMNYDVKCFANPNEYFSPLYFVFHANRYRPRMYVVISLDDR